MENITPDKRQIIVAIALVKDDQGRILLQKRIDPLIIGADGKWELPGGRIDYGETPEEAAVRECMEETGCEIKIKRLIPKIQAPIWSRVDGKEQQGFVICYEAELIAGTPKPLDKKVSEVGWFLEEDIAKLDTLRGIKEFIELSK